MNEKEANGWGQWFSSMMGTSARTLNNNGDEMTVDTLFYLSKLDCIIYKMNTLVIMQIMVVEFQL